MSKTIETMNTLDSQLTILNIEGICSEYWIWEEEEVEAEEVSCRECEGRGEVVAPDEPDLVWDRILCEYVPPADIVECESCDGTGIVIIDKTVKYKDSWLISNIFI